MKICSKSLACGWHLSLLVLTFFGSPASAQGQKFGVKIYQNTDLFSTRTSDHGVTSEKWTANFNRISFAIDLNARNNITHEIEVFIPEHSKRLEDVGFPYGYHLNTSLSAANRESNFAMRYELSKKITQGKGPFSATLGVALNPYILHIHYTPTSEAAYYTSLKDYGVSINVVPGLTYSFLKRFQLSLNLPLKVYDMTYKIKEIRNPSIPIRQQETKSYDHTFFEKVFTMRFGVACTFGR